MNRTDHFVQFYESDDFIANSVAEYFFHGIEGNARCICVATGDHTDKIFDAMRTFGIDPAKAVESGLLIMLDASEMLSTFMRDGSPDARLFKASIGKLVKETMKTNAPVRVYGEMVAVLWASGEYDAAVRVEELWNDLREECDFSLFCAYPLKGFAQAGQNGQLRQVCDRHTKTIPAESYSSLTTPEERLRAIAYLQQRAEQLSAEIADLELESRTGRRWPDSLKT